MLAMIALSLPPPYSLHPPPKALSPLPLPTLPPTCPNFTIQGIYFFKSYVKKDSFHKFLIN